MAPGQCRPCQPRPAQGDVGDRELPHGGLGGHVARCEDCAYTSIAYNSCRNCHCPKCQGAAAKEWLADREADLLPVLYYHVVFTLPAAIADIAYQRVGWVELFAKPIIFAATIDGYRFAPPSYGL